MHVEFKEQRSGWLEGSNKGELWTSLKNNSVQSRLMSFLPGGIAEQGTGHSKKSTCKPLITSTSELAASQNTEGLHFLPLYVWFTQFCVWVWQLLGHHPFTRWNNSFFAFRRLKTCTHHLTCRSWKMPPYLSELEDASCAHILGRSHLNRAVLPVLIQL